MSTRALPHHRDLFYKQEDRDDSTASGAPMYLVLGCAITWDFFHDDIELQSLCHVKEQDKCQRSLPGSHIRP